MFLKSRQNFKKFAQLFRGKTNYPVKNCTLFQKHPQRKSALPYLTVLRSYTTDISTNNDGLVLEGRGERVLRGRAATGLQESFIINLISSKEEISIEDWSELVKNISKIEFGNISSLNIHGRIMEYCFVSNHLNGARSYLKYMKANGIKYNSAVVVSFIKHCYEKRTFLTEEDHSRIEQFTRFLIIKYPILDSVIGEAIIKGLCLKNDLEKCAQVLEQIKQFVKPNSATISAYNICLLEHDQFEKAWAIMEEYGLQKNMLNHEIFVTYIKKMGSQLKEIERLLKFFQFNDIIPAKSVCDHLTTVFAQLPPNECLTATYTSIKNNGKCMNCGEKLNNVDISEEEFNVLREEFLNRVLKKDDIFKNTTPEELEKFKKCVEQNAPFDIVIDGLNVVYMAGTLKSSKTYAKLLTDTVCHFVERGQKVLVIGRKHMYSYSKESLNYVRKNATFFLIDDNSEDDPYMIYSTLYSGLDACFVTRDLMRSEKFRLGDEQLEFLFKKWQQSHQIFINFVSPGTGKVYLKSPIMFEMSAQRSKHGWHIPYHPETYTGEDEYGVHQHWLCLKK